jgi:DNA helicase-2/ATP-dependent DNA helicase PcrA
MSGLWRKHGTYLGVADAVKDALLQEHFSAPVRPVHGISVMKIHKSKGKESSEVPLYEDPTRDDMFVGMLTQKISLKHV